MKSRSPGGSPRGSPPYSPGSSPRSLKPGKSGSTKSSHEEKNSKLLSVGTDKASVAKLSVRSARSITKQDTIQYKAADSDKFSKKHVTLVGDTIKIYKKQGLTDPEIEFTLNSFSSVETTGEYPAQFHCIVVTLDDEKKHVFGLESEEMQTEWKELMLAEVVVMRKQTVVVRSTEVFDMDLNQCTTLYRTSVTVLQANALMKKDLFGKSDPYVVASLDGTLFWQTDVVKSTLDPVWNQSVEFITKTRPRKLKLNLWDWNKRTAPDPLGEVMLELKPNFDTGKKEKLQLQLENAKSGIMCIELHCEIVIPNESQVLAATALFNAQSDVLKQLKNEKRDITVRKNEILQWGKYIKDRADAGPKKIKELEAKLKALNIPIPEEQIVEGTQEEIKMVNNVKREHLQLDDKTGDIITNRDPHVESMLMSIGVDVLIHCNTQALLKKVKAVKTIETTILLVKKQLGSYCLRYLVDNKEKEFDLETCCVFAGGFIDSAKWERFRLDNPTDSKGNKVLANLCMTLTNEHTNLDICFYSSDAFAKFGRTLLTKPNVTNDERKKS